MFSKDLNKTYPEAIRFLTNAIAKGKLANSYVFIGSDINDILLISINIAMILNCMENKTIISNPCDNCTNCNWLKKNEHPQAFIIVEPDTSSKKEQIKIESIRELLNTLKVTSGYYRTVFLKNSNLSSLPSESGNLLLKTIEEAPERIIFIFANATKNDILPTILSRSQTLYLSKKYDSLEEMINNKDTNSLSEILTNCFSLDIKSALEKSKVVLEYIEENKVNLRDYLYSSAVLNYNECKYLRQKEYIHIHKNLSSAYLKSKSFMQPKIVLQDLFLNLCP